MPRPTIFLILAAAAAAAALTAAPATAKAAHCPPGLAKKNPPCVPPGLAKNKLAHEYRVGDYLDRDDFRVIIAPRDYGLERDGRYVELEGIVFRVDRETGLILTILGAAAELLN